MPHRLTALPVLPEPLAALGPLAHGLAAEWDDGLAGLFRALAPDSDATAPLALLAAATPARLAELAADDGFVEAIAAAVARESERLGAEAWYATLPGDRPRAIAYLSPEFGVSDALPQYSGGLGVLAGDHLKAATDLGVPIVGVGLFYRNGYFRQHADGVAASSAETFDALDPGGAADAPRRRRRRRARQHQRAAARRRCCTPPSGRSTSAACRCTCSTPTCPRTRRPSGPSPTASTAATASTGCARRSCSASAALKALAAVGAEPEVFHFNEGHAGFLGIERVRLPGRGAGPRPAAAIEPVRAATVFTTHTPVPAGIDRFSRDLVATLLRAGRRAVGPADRAAARPRQRARRRPAPSSTWRRSAFASSARVNGVSRLHGQVAREHVRRSTSRASRPTRCRSAHITNGVHAETWIGPRVRGALPRAHRRRLRPADARLRGAGGVLRRRARRSARRGARAAGRTRCGGGCARRGRRAASATASSRSSTACSIRTRSTIGFARRVPTYKRLTLMLRDPRAPRAPAARRRAAGADRDRRQGAPDDDEGKAMIAEFGAFAARPRPPPPHRDPRRLRHGDRARASSPASTCGSTTRCGRSRHAGRAA